MLIDWFQLLPAFLLLLTPIALFHSQRVRYRPVDHGWSGYWTRTFSLGLHTIDFGRAMLGAWWLENSISTGSIIASDADYSATILQACVLMMAAVVQAFICKQRGAAHAPFAFVAGLAAGFLPPLIAVFAILLAVVISAGLRTPAIFFPLLSCAVFGTGLLFKHAQRAQQILPLAALAIAVALPWLLTLLFPRFFVSSYAARRSSSTGARSQLE